ncbi:MAG: hypothetical protein MN733_39745, partial [Nitrososphaera sp.]|nr:hypothetical protein [Nitrososphaera sp.]
VAPTVFHSSGLKRGRWYCVELVSDIQALGTGTATLWLDGVQVAQVTTLTNTAVLRGVLGDQNTLATTLGKIFIDEFVFDDTQIGPIVDRFPEVRLVTKSAHVALGESELLNVTFIPGAGTDHVLRIYDTDVAYTQDENAVVAHLYNLTASEPPIDLSDVPVSVKRGAYVRITGTSGARAYIHIGRSQGHMGEGRIRMHGNRRTIHPIAN